MASSNRAVANRREPSRADLAPASGAKTFVDVVSRKRAHIVRAEERSHSATSYEYQKNGKLRRAI